MIKDYQWLEVHNNAKEAIRATNSYGEAVAHAERLGELFDWEDAVIEWTLVVILTMFERKSFPTITKINDIGKL